MALGVVLKQQLMDSSIITPTAGLFDGGMRACRIFDRGALSTGGKTPIGMGCTMAKLSRTAEPDCRELGVILSLSPEPFL